ncbi:MAG: hypothetical protein KKE05_03005 [Nanoarchaeota archaeon]|nr:hypothetical protein [Nanoarchaeota archaeon]
MGKKSVAGAFFEGVFGILFFLILLGIANLISDSVGNETFSSVVGFFNSNILFLILISVVMLVGAIFSVLWFPFNLPHPVFHAIGGIMIVQFLFSLFDFLGLMALDFLYLPAMIVVPLLTLFIGYILIFVRLFSLDREERKEKIKKMKGRSEKEWEDIVERKVKEGIEKLRGEEEDDKKKKRKRR